ncbi:MAG: oxidoreductase [Candidatus Kerfeldbacteria bacterium]|nr:oxidoreductase [Candidatus Kerfeldbacteria bacterium]
MQQLDRLLNGITMYRVVFYGLLFLVTLGTLWCFVGILPFSGFAIIGTSLLLLGLCWSANRLFARIFRRPAHDDSAYITALILTLIVPPYQTPADLRFLLLVPILAIAGKHIVAVRRQHLFNPAAFAVVIAALIVGRSANWWVGNAAMFPAVLLVGILIIHKQRRWDVVAAFLPVALLTTTMPGVLRGFSLPSALASAVVYAPLFFFASVMLTEPFTLPPTRRLRMLFGVVVALLLSPQAHVGSIFSTPELALIAGNGLFAFFSGRGRAILRFRFKRQIAHQITEFVFDGPLPDYRPGQYFEWMVPHRRPDSRGIRRYFTIASSPTEGDVRLGVKIFSNGSSFKRALQALQPGQTVLAEQRDGDFILPRDPNAKLAFLAGGIGVTPFRSIIKYLLDTHARRSILLLYACQTVGDIAYRDVFDQAERELDIRTMYVLSDTKAAPRDWKGPTGYITADIIRTYIPDFAERRFYLSGPQAMVSSYIGVLGSLDIPRRKIMTDYFPGFA